VDRCGGAGGSSNSVVALLVRQCAYVHVDAIVVVADIGVGSI